MSVFGYQKWIIVICPTRHIARSCCWTDELTETPQDAQVEKNHEEETYCANSLLIITDNVHRSVKSKLSDGRFTFE